MSIHYKIARSIYASLFDFFLLCKKNRSAKDEYRRNT
jgi:hypothetical protein